ncbi:MAG: toprim domain-containing protein [Proteobacteria bacterium]|nr:toprim domain-containing protein [Pseudomonadota bacterium]
MNSAKPDYIQLKSETYLNQIVNYAEGLLDVKFHSMGENRYSTFCPFHAETKNSFRVYVNGKDEVRFHCFGACGSEWDLYDIIMLRKKCGFREAQRIWAEYLNIKDFSPFDGKSSRIPEPDIEPEPDDTVLFAEPEPDPEIITALDEGACFYNKLLLSDEEGFSEIFKYLLRRGVGKDLISRFKIGYAPSYSDTRYEGRALISNFLPRFEKDYTTFKPFDKASLVRLLNDGASKAYFYYRKQIDNSREKDIFSKNYGDYFAGKIVFPIFNSDASIVGLIGRRTDNRCARWIKQKTNTVFSTKSWLYGIDKASRYIKQYRAVILVEGIFDYFAFYNLLQDQEKPIVVSTLGSHLTDEALNIFKSLGVEHFIIAYDWDQAGKNGIGKIASQVGGKVYFLGGLKEGQDPYDMLKHAVNAIDGFSLDKLMTSAKKTQEKTGKPVNIHIMSRGSDVVFETTDAGNTPDFLKGISEAKEFIYDVDDFLPLLSYDHGNKAMLEENLQQIIKLLETRPEKLKSEKIFTIPANFLKTEGYTDLGQALILWIRLVIEQQTRRRKIAETDETLADWLRTSRQTISKHKSNLKSLGFLNIDASKKLQKLSVKYFPKQTDITP